MATQVEFSLKILQNNSLGLCYHMRKFVFRKNASHTNYFNAFLEQNFQLKLGDWTTVYFKDCVSKFTTIVFLNLKSW